MIFRVFRDGEFTKTRIDASDKDAMQKLDRHISATGFDEWEGADDDKTIITEKCETCHGTVIVELRMEHFDMNESDEVQEIHIWELMKDG